MLFATLNEVFWITQIYFLENVFLLWEMAWYGTLVIILRWTSIVMKRARHNFSTRTLWSKNNLCYHDIPWRVVCKEAILLYQISFKTSVHKCNMMCESLIAIFTMVINMISIITDSIGNLKTLNNNCFVAMDIKI